jgi:hypothetical protein
MSDAAERHLDKAFASLDDLTVRELQASADAIGRRSPLYDFVSIFRNVADARDGGWDTDLPRFHLEQAVSRADDDLLERLEGAKAPFWAHVRDALAERNP